MVKESEKPGAAVAEVCRHGITAGLLFRWRVQFVLTARNALQLAMWRCPKARRMRCRARSVA